MTTINVIISYKIPFASLLSKARWGHKGKLLFRRKHRALLALSITLLQETGLEREKKERERRSSRIKERGRERRMGGRGREREKVREKWVGEVEE